MGAKTGVAPKIRALHDKYPQMSDSAIARRVGCHPSNVAGVLKTYLDDSSLEELREFQENKADIFDAIQHRLLASVTQDKINKTNAVSAITGAAILEDKARLVRGQATSINVNVLMDVVEAIKSKQG